MPRSLSNSTTSGRIVRYRLRPGLDFVKLLLRSGLRDEPLGSGGMGEVWKTSHRLLARPAGIKLIRFDQILDRDSDKADIFVCRYGIDRDFVKFLDFGIKDPAADAAGSVSGGRVIAGTPGYMPSEMALGSPNVDWR